MVPAVPRLHLISDTILQHQWSHFQLYHMAIATGLPLAVQFREKRPIHLADDSDFLQMRSNPPHAGQVLILNDRVDDAINYPQMGLHVGIADGDWPTIIAATRANALVGATVHNEVECAMANALPFDYVGIGPVFGSSSKATGLPPLGLDGLAALVRLSKHPVIAIGSIAGDNLEAVLKTGVYGVAVLSAFACAPNPSKVVEELYGQIAAYFKE
jgi:thiamine-phosphate pyrophosphorylase